MVSDKYLQSLVHDLGACIDQANDIHSEILSEMDTLRAHNTELESKLEAMGKRPLTEGKIRGGSGTKKEYTGNRKGPKRPPPPTTSGDDNG